MFAQEYRKAFNKAFCNHIQKITSEVEISLIQAKIQYGVSKFLDKFKINFALRASFSELLCSGLSWNLDREA